MKNFILTTGSKKLMINWQVIAQLISLGIIVLVGPAVIILLSFKKGNL